MGEQFLQKKISFTKTGSRTGSMINWISNSKLLLHGLWNCFGLISLGLLLSFEIFTIMTSLSKSSCAGGGAGAGAGGGAGGGAGANWIHIQRPSLFPHLSRPAKAAHKNSWPCPAYGRIFSYPGQVYLVLHTRYTHGIIVTNILSSVLGVLMYWESGFD